MANLFLVFLGGGIGSVLRFGVTALLAGTAPWGTLLVNAVGGLLAGLAAASLVDRAGPGALFLITGVLGGFTTFSAFSLDALMLWQRGQVELALAYVVASVMLAVLGAALGYYALS